MKLLAILAVAVTCGLIVFLEFTDSARKDGPILAAVDSQVPRARDARPTPAVLQHAGGGDAARDLADSDSRVEILAPEFDLDIPDSHWMPAAPPIGELEHPNGPWLRLHENGVIDEQGAYENDLEVGTWNWWYENGERKAIGHFRNGLEVGTWTWWHENGEVLGEGQYENGEGFGPWKIYWDNGTLRKEGNYVDGELSGHWGFWFPSGMVDEEKTGMYEAGVKVE